MTASRKKIIAGRYLVVDKCHLIIVKRHSVIVRSQIILSWRHLSNIGHFERRGRECGCTDGSDGVNFFYCGIDSSFIVCKSLMLKLYFERRSVNLESLKYLV